MGGCEPTYTVLPTFEPRCNTQIAGLKRWKQAWCQSSTYLPTNMTTSGPAVGTSSGGFAVSLPLAPAGLCGSGMGYYVHADKGQLRSGAGGALLPNCQTGPALHGCVADRVTYLYGGVIRHQWATPRAVALGWAGGFLPAMRQSIEPGEAATEQEEVGPWPGGLPIGRVETLILAGTVKQTAEHSVHMAMGAWGGGIWGRKGNWAAQAASSRRRQRGLGGAVKRSSERGAGRRGRARGLVDLSPCATEAHCPGCSINC